VRRALLLVAVLAASALAVGTASVRARSLVGNCVPDKQAGAQLVNHVPLIVYCGHAKLTLKQGTKITHYTKGMCLRPPGNLIVGFGKYTAISHPIAVGNSFVLIVPASGDGTYRLSQLTIQTKGKRAKIANNPKVVVKGKRSRGTFSGKFPDGKRVSGSFTCK